MGNKAPDSWLGEIEVTHLDYERVPVLGRSFFNEVHPLFLSVPAHPALTCACASAQAFVFVVLLRNSQAPFSKPFECSLG